MSKQKRHDFKSELTNLKITLFKASKIISFQAHHIPSLANKSKIVLSIEYPSLESYERSVMYSLLDYVGSILFISPS